MTFLNQTTSPFALTYCRSQKCDHFRFKKILWNAAFLRTRLFGVFALKENKAELRDRTATRLGGQLTSVIDLYPQRAKHLCLSVSRAATDTRSTPACRCRRAAWWRVSAQNGLSRNGRTSPHSVAYHRGLHSHLKHLDIDVPSVHPS